MAALIGSLLAAGCGTSGDQSTSDEEGDGDNYAGTDNNSGGTDVDDEGADVLPTYPTEHPRIYIGKHRDRLKAALDANTAAATRLRSTVDGWLNGQDIWGFQVWNAALLGQVTGDPKYCAKAVASIDAEVASEEAKIAAGTQPVVAQNSYLHVGEELGDVALVYDWCFDVVTPGQRTRWLAYMNTTLWNLWHHTEAKWGPKPMPWLGWSVNDPLNNYYYSFLRATALVGLATKGETPQGDEWITMFRDTKMYGQLIPAFDAQLRGGGSLEGSAYGVSLRYLWNLYDLWYSTTGEKLQAKTKHARQSLRYFIHHVLPTLDRIAPNGDQPRDMTAMFFDYQRQYLQALIHLYPNDPMSARGKALLESSSLPQMMRPEMVVYDFMYDNDDVTSQPLEGAGKAYHASGIGQLYARSGWDKSATWVNFSAGPYVEDHAHQDQGSLLIYKDGWLGYDGVIDSTNGIIQETGSHSLVRINKGGTPLKQKIKTNSKLVGVKAGQGFTYGAADVTAAYAGDPSVSKVQREMIYLEPNTVIVYDRVVTAADTTQTWQLATPLVPAISGATATMRGAHTLAAQRLVPATASTASTSLANSAGYRAGYRVDTTQPGGDHRYLHVLSIDGSVASATASGDNAATIALANGKTATVTFNRDDIGATLEYDGATSTLGAGHDSLPE
ncbi:MAG TPA: hypothetical protein VIV11_17060 [Kofleriaceae bacterium]